MTGAGAFVWICWRVPTGNRNLRRHVSCASMTRASERLSAFTDVGDQQGAFAPVVSGVTSARFAQVFRPAWAWLRLEGAADSGFGFGEHIGLLRWVVDLRLSKRLE